MKGPKNTSDDKKENETPEIKEKLSEDELEGVSGGATPWGEVWESNVWVRCYGLTNSLINTTEDPKNIKEELTDEETKGIDGGNQPKRNPPFDLEELKADALRMGDIAQVRLWGNACIKKEEGKDIYWMLLISLCFTSPIAY